MIIYRVGIWLPLIVPAVVVGMVNGFDLRPAGWAAQKVVQVWAFSLVYGGIPYTLLALWAAWWIRDRSEQEIRRLMFRAPLFMAALFALMAVVVGIAVRQPSAFVAVGSLGALVTIPLGYAYVGIVLWLVNVTAVRNR